MALTAAAAGARAAPVSQAGWPQAPLAQALSEGSRAISVAVDPAPANRKPTRSEAQVTRVARTSGRLRDWIDDHPIARTASSFNSKTGLHTVFFVSEDEQGEETVEAQVLVSDETGRITEVRTGPQVSWMMARGYPGAFGRALNRPVIWIALCVLFVLPLLPLLRPRRLLRMRTLDLLALLSFSISLIWFNEGEIFTSVPLAYPPLVYLLVRLCWIAWARARAARRAAAAPAEGEELPAAPRRPGLAGFVPTWAMVTVLALVLALRFGLNAFDSNVIDVGYAGVIGAQQIQDGRTPYGTFPSDCGACDTYGPLNYLVYVPFELAAPWHGGWGSLSAAHGAATAFDLLAIAGMLLLGWRLAGLRLGVALALAWAAFPFTAYSLETNSNDSLVAALLIWGIVLAQRPLGRGLMLGFALASKFAPAVLVPLWLRRPFPRGRRRDWPGVIAGMALAGVAVGWVLLLDGLDGVRAFWSRTIGYQLERDSPFSLWGQYPGLRPLQIVLMGLVGLAALAVLRWPRRLDLLTVSALSGALLIGLQLTLTHWFYLYIPWFLPFALIAMVPDWPPPDRRDSPPEPAQAPAQAPEPVPA